MDSLSRFSWEEKGTTFQKWGRGVLDTNRGGNQLAFSRTPVVGTSDRSVRLYIRLQHWKHTQVHSMYTQVHSMCAFAFSRSSAFPLPLADLGAMSRVQLPMYKHWPTDGWKCLGSSCGAVSLEKDFLFLGRITIVEIFFFRKPQVKNVHLRIQTSEKGM